MKEPHTQEKVEHTNDQQNTGNHKKAPDKGTVEHVGGSREGAENVEPSKKG